MSRGYLHSNDLIAAMASAPGEAAIAVIRLAGPGCIERLAEHFSRPEILRACPSHQAVYGRVLDSGRQALDEVLALVFRAPGGYTGQDGVDILCHGGQAVTEALLSLFQSAGFARALPGEFTFRAFMNGKLDLAKAEAVDELVRARTGAARSNALARLSGGLSRRLDALHKELVRLAAACALRLDYGEDESPESFAVEVPALQAVRDQCAALSATYAVGRLLKDGARVVIAGRTNAGKSSLFNCLLKEERAIVSSQHGTTRDYVEAALDLGGLPVSLVDTAGLRVSDDEVEAEGMRRSRLLLDAADLVLYVVDAAEGLAPEDSHFLEAYQAKLLPVWNKIDQPAALPPPATVGWLAVSARDGSGEQALVTAIRNTLLVSAPATDGQSGPALSRTADSALTGLAITSARQRAALERAVASLDDALGLLALDEAAENTSLDMLAVDIMAALAALGEITGETTPEAILDSLFANFCVGK